MTDPVPFPDTHDLRSGPDLHPALLGLLPYVGLWRGVGKGGVPGGEDFDFAQEVRFAHDGGPFLAYDARSWILGAEGAPLRPGPRESGWWRALPDDSVEMLLSHPDGLVEVSVGRLEGTRVELTSDVVARTPGAPEITASHRLYGIVERDLLYAVDRAVGAEGPRPWMSARLARIGG